MKFKVDHDMHIHSRLSLCSNDPEQSTERILKYALDNGFSTVAVTDHYWDEHIAVEEGWYAAQNTAHLSENLPLPKADGVRFLFGCETELRRDLTLGISDKSFDKFDFIVIPTTHLHMAGFTIDGNADVHERAEAYCRRLETVLAMDLPFHKVGIAHLACVLMEKHGRPQDIISLISDEKLYSMFEKAAKLGVGIELNSVDFDFEGQPKDRIDETLRLFGIAKKAGCKFYFGSDAHHPNVFERTKEIAENAVEALGLEEKDKFII